MAIETRHQLMEVIHKLLNEKQNGEEWENETAADFLETLAGWMNDADGYYKNMNMDLNTDEASWQFFADALQAATIYE